MTYLVSFQNFTQPHLPISFHSTLRLTAMGTLMRRKRCQKNLGFFVSAFEEWWCKMEWLNLPQLSANKVWKSKVRNYKFELCSDKRGAWGAKTMLYADLS